MTNRRQRFPDFLAPVTALVVAATLALAALAGAAPAGAGSRLAGMKGVAATGMQVQNLDPAQTLTAVVDFYRQGGGGPKTLILPPVPPHFAYNIYLPQGDGLADGLYAAIISGDRRLSAITRTEWPESGAAAMYNLPQPAHHVTLPLVLKDSYGHSAIVTVQSTDSLAEQRARLEFTRTGEPGLRLTVEISLPAGESRTLDLARDAAFEALPAGFFGSLRVTAEVPVAVQATFEAEGSDKAVYSLLGVPSEMADLTAYLPLFVSGLGGADTLVAIANPGSRPVTAEITVRGSAGSCQGRTYRTRTGSIAPGSNLLAYRWPGGVGGAQAEVPGLPTACLGAATVTADGPILAVASYLTGDPSRPTVAAAYNAFGPSEGGMAIGLPLYRNLHLSYQMTTGIQAMNLGAAPAEARIAFYMQGMTIEGASCPACRQRIGPGEAYTWFPPSMPELPSGKYGSAWLESDQPLAVVVADTSLRGGMDTGVYRGLVVDDSPPPLIPTAEPEPGFAPILVKRAELRGPLRPTPEAVAATPTSQPRAAVRVFLPIGFGG